MAPADRLPVLLVLALALPAAETGYVNPSTCRTCHAKIYDGYMQTGMGRSFSQTNSVPEQAGAYYHAASARYYEVVRRDDRYFLRRYQAGDLNVIEKPIDYEIGSGNHSRTYLHRSPSGKLLELPLSWYSERGGYWAMSPGYDRPDHSDFRREVSDACLFCHNGYPSLANGGLANGIDCQRCHGPGEAHARGEGGIINPGKLSSERQMEVCMQCHLESASRTIPDSIRRYNRSPFSYRPGEPLGDFMIYFDYQKRRAPDDGITVNHSAYGLRKSACFVRSQGRMTCTTCHDPHQTARGETAQARYTSACRSCHATQHEAATRDCAGCHMPKRRTEDAVHVVMTDHYIQRKPPAAGLLAPIPESHDRYSGDVKLYYPAALPDTAENRLYLAVARVRALADPREAIAELARAITESKLPDAMFYFELAEACRKAGRPEDAIHAYQQATERKPDLVPAYVSWSELLLSRGLESRAIAILEHALKIRPNEPDLLNGLAVSYARQERFDDSVALLRKAVAINPDVPVSWLNLGVGLQQRQDYRGAEAAYRTALRLQPDFTRAKRYLSGLAGAGPP